MYLFEPISVQDVLKRLSSNCRSRRLEKNMSQRTLSETSGIPLSTIQRFEHTGEISLRGFVSLARALGYASDMMELMSKPKYKSLDEMIDINKNKSRKRGTDEGR